MYERNAVTRRTSPGIVIAEVFNLSALKNHDDQFLDIEFLKNSIPFNNNSFSTSI